MQKWLPRSDFACQRQRPQKDFRAFGLPGTDETQNRKPELLWNGEAKRLLFAAGFIPDGLQYAPITHEHIAAFTTEPALKFVLFYDCLPVDSLLARLYSSQDAKRYMLMVFIKHVTFSNSGLRMTHCIRHI